MTYHNAKEIATAVGIQAKHVWRDVRRYGIEPTVIHGINTLNESQMNQYMKCKGIGDIPNRPPRPRKTKPSKKQQIVVRDVTANASELAANRARIARMERLAMKTHKATVIPADREIYATFDWAASVGK